MSRPIPQGTGDDATAQGLSDAVARAHRAHPLLDPMLATRQRSARRFWLPIHRRLRLSPRAADDLLARFTTTLTGRRQPLAQPIARYFADADRYIDDLLRLAPTSVRESLGPLPDTCDLRDVGAIVQTIFDGTSLRQRYEAQRKLCLMMLLFDIDHTRNVRDASRHLAAFEHLLERTIWRGVGPGTAVEVALVPQPHGRTTIAHVRTGHPAPTWPYAVRRLAQSPGATPIDVYEYRSRLKREGRPPTGEDAGIGRPRTGSILSKMIRRGIDDAHQVADVLGAMFIVGSRRQAYALERWLVDAVAGPFRWRDRVDTLTTPEDAARLTDASSPAFRVLKQTVDLLMEDAQAPSPYLVPIEIQIHPIATYLEGRTGSGPASHRAYKWRQFTRELAPILFPPAVFGDVAFPPVG